MFFWLLVKLMIKKWLSLIHMPWLDLKTVFGKKSKLKFYTTSM